MPSPDELSVLRHATLRVLAPALALGALVGCGAETEPTPTPEPTVQRPAPAAPRRCGADEAWEGGEVLETDDGARLYYRVAGPADAPVVVYLHGGPGGNALSLERSAGPRLEASLRMVYLDQRGCGRSNGGPADLPLGMDPSLADLERLRTALGVTRWTVLGHSFGGLQALVYANRHADAVDKLVLVEATVDPHAALEHQVEVLGEGSPELAAVAASQSPPFDRLLMIYQMLGRGEVQRRLHWTSPDAQRRAESWETTARLTSCTRDGVLATYRSTGWVDPRPELQQRRAQRTLFVAGRQSRVLGEPAVTSVAETLGAEVRWLEQSGHFPFVEEPEAFAETVVRFVESAAPPEPEPRPASPRRRRTGRTAP